MYIMGVNGLQKFIETKVPEGCKDVNIGQMAKYSNRSNVLVVDLFNLARKPLEYFDLETVIT